MPRTILLALLSGSVLFLGSAVWAEGDVAVCAAVRPGARAGDAVSIYAEAGAAAALLDAAIGQWSQGCAGEYGRGFPRLERRENASQAAYRVHLEAVNRLGPECGRLRGRDLYVYRYSTVPAGKPLHCGDASSVLAHEIGHALGLRDVDSAICPTAVMADPITPANKPRRRVQPVECRAVADAWLTKAELAPSEVGPVLEIADAGEAANPSSEAPYEWEEVVAIPRREHEP